MPTGGLKSRPKSSVTVYKALEATRVLGPKGPSEPLQKALSNSWRHSERFRLGLVELVKRKQTEDYDPKPSMWHVSCHHLVPYIRPEEISECDRHTHLSSPCLSPVGQSLSVQVPGTAGTVVAFSTWLWNLLHPLFLSFGLYCTALSKPFLSPEAPGGHPVLLLQGSRLSLNLISQNLFLIWPGTISSHEPPNTAQILHSSQKVSLKKA